MKHIEIPTLALAALLASCGAAPAVPPPDTVVTTVLAHKSSASDALSISGLLVSEKEARLSFKTGGIIQRVAVKEGDTVREGQVLAFLNPTEIDAQLAQAQEGLTKANRDLDRMKDLFTQSVTTKEQLDNATTAAQLAQRSFDIAKYNRTYSEIRAPEDGIVLRKLMNEGELASPGTPVFQFGGSAASDWVLRCGVSDKVWARLTLGNPADVSFDAFPGERFDGSLVRLSQGTDATGLYQVDIRVKPGNRRFASGLFGRGDVRVPAPLRGLSVPIDALVRGQGDKARLFIAVAGKAEPRDVRVLAWNSETATVIGDLGEGNRVIVDGAAWLTPGAAVRTVE